MGSDSQESACNTEDLGSIPGSGRSLGEDVATHSTILAWTEEPGRLQSRGVAEADMTERLTLKLTLIKWLKN